MKYHINFQGWETEILIDEVPEKLYKHFKDNNLDVSLHMCGTMEDELSDEITDGINCDTKFECDKLYHNCGPNMDGSVTMHVVKVDTDEEVYSVGLDDWNGDFDCEKDVCLLDFEPRYIMIGQIFSKGYAAEYVLELKDDEEFDSSQLTLLYHDIDETHQIVTGVKYNDVDLECTGELDTRGRDERWFIEDTETRERTTD
jgi:hypothetical protein